MNLQEHMSIFRSGRESMRVNNTDLLRLGILCEGEFGEFATALLDYLTSPTQESAQELAQEVADVVLYLEQIVSLIGSDLLTEVLDKVAYNTTRFTSKDFTEKPYTHAYSDSKQWVKDTGWKQDYYSEPLVEYDHTIAHKTQRMYNAPTDIVLYQAPVTSIVPYEKRAV